MKPICLNRRMPIKILAAETLERFNNWRQWAPQKAGIGWVEKMKSSWNLYKVQQDPKVGWALLSDEIIRGTVTCKTLGTMEIWMLPPNFLQMQIIKLYLQNKKIWGRCLAINVLPSLLDDSETLSLTPKLRFGNHCSWMLGYQQISPPWSTPVSSTPECTVNFQHAFF